MPCLLFPSIRAIVTIYFGHCINTLPQNYTTEIQRNIIRSNVEREVDIVVYKNWLMGRQTYIIIIIVIIVTRIRRHSDHSRPREPERGIIIIIA